MEQALIHPTGGHHSRPPEAIRAEIWSQKQEPGMKPGHSTMESRFHKHTKVLEKTAQGITIRIALTSPTSDAAPVL